MVDLLPTPGVCLMSLAAASESRKERLIALRNRKLGQTGATTDGDEYEKVISPLWPINHVYRPGTFRFKQRNYDPETRTLRKRTQDDTEEDTVERQVDGLAEKIIAEDEERRAQELVNILWYIFSHTH